MRFLKKRKKKKKAFDVTPYPLKKLCGSRRFGKMVKKSLGGRSPPRGGDPVLEGLLRKVAKKVQLSGEVNFRSHGWSYFFSFFVHHFVYFVFFMFLLYLVISFAICQRTAELWLD